jgi:hypothetical protein
MFGWKTLFRQSTVNRPVKKTEHNVLQRCHKFPQWRISMSKWQRTYMNATPGWDAAQMSGLVREELLLERLEGIVQILPLNELNFARSQRRDGRGGWDVSIKQPAQQIWGFLLVGIC